LTPTCKTLHLTNAFHATSGGIAAFYRALLAEAVRQERQLTLVVPAAAARLENVSPTCHIYYLAAPPAPFFDRRYRLLLPQTYLPGGALRRILQTEQPDVLEVCDKYALNWLAGLLRRGWLPGVKRPVLLGASHERMDDNVAAYLTNQRAVQRLTQLYLGYCYLPLFDYHVANSAYTAAELHAARRPGHEREVYVRPVGIEVEALSACQGSALMRARLWQQTGGGPPGKLLLYAGRLAPEKNVRLLLEMLEHLPPDYRLLIAGAGPLAAELQRQAAHRTPGRLCWLGHLSDRQALLDLYANCDAFVHPNPREPFGIAPLEALAAGLPLIAPRAGGVLSYASDANAWLAEPNGPAFAAAVQAVFALEPRRAERLAQGRATAQRYGWATVTQAWFTLYEELQEQFPASRFAPVAPAAGWRAASEKNPAAQEP
jgi:alpha-1,6-mannosyltransferase